MPNDYPYSDATIQDLVRETEREILDDALGHDDPEDVMPSDLIADQSQLEGWDGRPLTEGELIHTTAFGHETPGFDRPVAWAAEQDAIRQNELLRAELAQRDQELLALMQGPEAQEAMRQQRERRRDEFLQIAVDDDKTDAHIAQVDALRNAVHGQNFDRVNAALEHAHRTYGRDFEQTYAEVSALKNNRNPMAQQIIQSIFQAEDPGEALMSLAGSPLVHSLTEGRRGDNPPPFMPGSRSAPAAAQGRRVDEDDLGYELDAGGAGEEMERSIFEAATRR